jgi:hypothetical protein
VGARFSWRRAVLPDPNSSLGPLEADVMAASHATALPFHIGSHFDRMDFGLVFLQPPGAAHRWAASPKATPSRRAPSKGIHHAAVCARALRLRLRAWSLPSCADLRQVHRPLIACRMGGVAAAQQPQGAFHRATRRFHWIPGGRAMRRTRGGFASNADPPRHALRAQTHGTYPAAPRGRQAACQRLPLHRRGEKLIGL